MVSTHLKNISQKMGIFPKVRVFFPKARSVTDSWRSLLHRIGIKLIKAQSFSLSESQTGLNKAITCASPSHQKWAVAPQLHMWCWFLVSNQNCKRPKSSHATSWQLRAAKRLPTWQANAKTERISRHHKSKQQCKVIGQAPAEELDCETCRPVFCQNCF